MVPYIILIGYCIMVIVMQNNKLDTIEDVSSKRGDWSSSTLSRL